jgi:hypothetical protein
MWIMSDHEEMVGQPFSGTSRLRAFRAPCERVRVRVCRVDHFEVTSSLLISGRTEIARATVDMLNMNRALAVAIRQEEALKGRYP